ncbi:MAG TPA: BsuBI/PstI family type II restriction endonuclease [Roseiflexaceae bacterium]|nr:BsuBI/PstI family type II restriction endonuclease [Roseiflexaceae bacterium]
MDIENASEPAQQRINEALDILRSIGIPRQQQNERSALTLLALLALTPSLPWSAADDPLMGITPMMEFFALHYGKRYAPNTRETVRRQTVHQFLEAGLILANPDNPTRPVNSPKAVYQIAPWALALLRSYGTSAWSNTLALYLGSVQTLQQRYAQERQMQRIPVTLPSGATISLSPGGQNVLVQHILEEFAPRFTPGGEVIYVGDTEGKFVFFAEERLRELGVTVDPHGKMPDVIIYHTQREWLVLIEAATSHGPIDPKRRTELAQLFRDARVGLVYITALLTRQTLKEYLPAISWETEVWVAESPSHLIHFNGERFLGPYPVGI